MRASAWARLLSALALVFVARVVDAEEPSKLVLVAIAADDAHAFDALVDERVTAAGATPSITRLATLDPAIFLAPPAHDARALAHVWIDGSSPERFVVLLFDERLERGLVRYVMRDRGDEIAREEVGHILQTAIEALVAGETIGVTREQLYGVPAHRPVAARAVAWPRPTARWRVDAAGTYEVDLFARDLYAHGPGFSLDVSRSSVTSAFGIRLGAQARFPLDVRADPFSFRVESWAARALAFVAIHATPGWSVEGAVGGGVDVEHVVPTGSGPGTSLARSSDRAAFVVRAGMWLARRGPVRAALGIVVDVDTSGNTFDALDNGTRRALFSGYVVRPGLVLEIGTPR